MTQHLSNSDMPSSFAKGPFKATWYRQNVISNIRREIEDSYGRQELFDKQKGHITDDYSLPAAPERQEGDTSMFQPPATKIGIVGAGAAGLFTALLFDYLNDMLERSTSRKPYVPLKFFDYEILEANGPDRVGGRLFTYNFGGPEDTHDYYDVGAMRFPKTPVMQRTFDLFSVLGINESLLETAKKGCLVPYYMTNGAKDPTEPWRYNDITAWGGSYNEVTKTNGDDSFEMAVANEPPADLRKHSPDDIINAAIKPLRDALKSATYEGWNQLKHYDDMSTRQFLEMKPILKVPERDAMQNPIPPPPYSYQTIEWLETFNEGTNNYDQAHSETVLDSLDFQYEDHADIQWFCIDGGAQELARNMENKVRRKPIYKSSVKAIRAIGSEGIQLDYATEEGTLKTKTYDAVFNTTTLSCLGRMDFSQAGFDYDTKLAIRSLGYGSATKVAIKFKRAWWIHDLGKYSIKFGGLGHSDMNMRTWQQDAQRLAALVSSSKDHEEKVHAEAELKEVLIRELVCLHHNDGMDDKTLYRLISDNYVDHHAYDWGADPTTAGAFALFRPQQFSTLWEKMIRRTGNVVIVGEAMSPHHAWVVGALESVVHGVHHWLVQKSWENPWFLNPMAILEKEIPGNPFVGLPPYMDAKMVKWSAFLSILLRKQHEDEEKTKMGGTPCAVADFLSTTSLGIGGSSPV